jgi:hypothetical protein
MKPRVLEQKSQNLNKCNNNNTLQSYQEEKMQYQNRSIKREDKKMRTSHKTFSYFSRRVMYSMVSSGCSSMLCSPMLWTCGLLALQLLVWRYAIHEENVMLTHNRSGTRSIVERQVREKNTWWGLLSSLWQNLQKAKKRRIKMHRARFRERTRANRCEIALFLRLHLSVSLFLYSETWNEKGKLEMRRGFWFL